MSWIKTFMKPTKISIENPDYPVSSIYQDIPWELSGGTKQACMVACAFILALDVDTVIEIGAWQGFSSLMLGRTLAVNSRSGLLVTIDVNPNALTRASNFTKGLPIEHRLVKGDSMQEAFSLPLDGRVPGLCFVDGEHKYEYCKSDLEKCAKVMKPYGVLVVHDYSKTGHPGVYQAVNEFVEQTGAAKIYLDENRESTDYRTAILQLSGNY